MRVERAVFKAFVLQPDDDEVVPRLDCGGQVNS